MEETMLKLLSFLGDSGYYARTTQEHDLMGELAKKGMVKLKPKTKSIYKLTKSGLDHIDNILQPNKKIDDKKFFQSIKKAYNNLSNPMKPLVRIPDIRKQVINECRIPDQLFNKKMITFHDEGLVTLQTALSRNHASSGGIDAPTGVYYYLMLGG